MGESPSRAPGYQGIEVLTINRDEAPGITQVDHSSKALKASSNAT